MGVMASPLYSDISFDRAIVGGIQSGAGLIATIVGGFLGGLIAYKLGVPVPYSHLLAPRHRTRSRLPSPA